MPCNLRSLEGQSFANGAPDILRTLCDRATGVGYGLLDDCGRPQSLHRINTQRFPDEGEYSPHTCDAWGQAFCELDRGRENSSPCRMNDASHRVVTPARPGRGANVDFSLMQQNESIAGTVDIDVEHGASHADGRGRRVD